MKNNAVSLVKIEDLIREIIVESGIPFYRIESHIDTQDNNGTVSSIPVIRIISFFEDSVNKVSGVLAGEFDMTPLELAEDKSIFAQSFSSHQAHFTVALKANRLQLAEYKKWSSTQFEVRICSMLQDAWAGLASQLSVNGNSTFPGDVRRDMFRVGMLLETADKELLKINNKLNPGGDAVSQPVFTPVAAQAATVASVAPQPAAQQNGIRMESMDMSVDSFSSLAFSINNVEQTTNGSDGRFLDLLTSNNSNTTANKAPVQPEPVAEVPQYVEPEPVNLWAAEPPAIPEINPAPQAAAAPSEGMALNIDNIETFNMNVNGMIERTTEIIREGSGSDRNSFENEEREKAPVVYDENAQMTDASLKEYVQTSKLLKEIDQMIADRAGAKVNDDIDIEGDVERLKFLKVFNLKQLQEKLSDNKTDIVAFAEKWIGKDNGGSFDSGISLFYLEYLLVGKKNDPAFAVEYVLKFISDNDYSARYIIPTYNSIKQTETAPNFSHLTLK